MPQYARRTYYDDTTCSTSLNLFVSVANAAPCLNPAPIISTCIIKGQDVNKVGALRSSEASGCEPATAINDYIWWPSLSDGKLIKEALYATINVYNGNDCLPTVLDEQDTFLADGKCHAVEYELSFYKATCSPSGGVKIDICSDSTCNSCGGGNTLKAGTYINTSWSNSANDQCQTTTGRAIKTFCQTPPELNAISPQTSTAGTTSASTEKPRSNGESISNAFGFLAPICAMALF